MTSGEGLESGPPVARTEACVHGEPAQPNNTTDHPTSDGILKYFVYLSIFVLSYEHFLNNEMYLKKHVIFV